MKEFNDFEDIQSEMFDLQMQGKTIAFVPTMGNLHEGHLSLYRLAQERADIVVGSLFINPTQFGPNEDLENYPRTLERDRELLYKVKCDYLFVPDNEEMYPQDFETRIVPGKLADGLCGAFRPGHFEGVATVVVKLCQIVPCDLLFLGEKDYQQYRVISQVFRDLNSWTSVEAAPIVREESGLALSSRNNYLTPEARVRAGCIYKVLTEIKQKVDQGLEDVATLKAQARDALANYGLDEVQYVEICQEFTLAPIDQIEEGARIFVAVQFEGVRLIDNLLLVSHKRLVYPTVL